MRSWLYRDAGGTRESLGLLILRVVVGAAFILHGWPKIQNAFEWMGPSATVPGFMQALAALAEFGGGIALILGVLTPLAAIGLIATMGGALYMVHLPARHPFVPTQPGDPSYELAAVYLAAAAALLLTGPGRFSLDALLFRGGACCGVPRVAAN
jgi:putative oxidoreductase